VQPQIDRHTFEELQQISGADFMSELVGTFLEDGPERIAELRSALSAHDSEVFRRAAHSLKSNGATFGAHQLADLARELEALGKEGRLEGLESRVDELETVYRKVVDELQGLVP
jgi:HPt (histidine-containing phosphotransfer) domain-containing protein